MSVEVMQIKPPSATASAAGLRDLGFRVSGLGATGFRGLGV